MIPKTNAPLILLRNVVKKYPVGKDGYYQALNGINLDIKKGEFVAITGASGSGKSTLMHILGALDIPTTGEYLFKGKNISSYSEDQLAVIRNREIGFVFQFFNLLPKMTVYENVQRPMLYSPISLKDQKERVLKALQNVNIADKANNLSNHISGGQIQRVAVARALIMDPSLVLADEPTGNLDSKTSIEIMNLLVTLNDEGRTIVVVTHDEQVAKFAKRIIKISDGQIISDVKRKNES